MKRLIKLAAIAASAFAFQNAYAFHSGGVAECGGCHSMHSPGGSSFLLVGADQSSTCLSCHEHAGDTGPSSYHISTADADLSPTAPPKQRTPGGDFAWLKRTYNYTLRGTAVSEAGASHGHNIVAPSKGYAAVSGTAPGGTFPASSLACNSCHDPHGKFRRGSDGTITTGGAPIIASGSYDNSVDPAAGQAVGVYRLLAGSGYANTSNGTIGFPGVPQAVAPATYNRTEGTTQTRVAYGVKSTGGHATWGKWCGTCHGDMHNGINSKYVHPVDQQLGATVKGIYETYKGSGDLTGTATASYLSLTPFATDNSATYADLRALAKNNDTALGGPGTSDQVMCLSCHRAHASGFSEMLRWNMEGEIILVDGSWPGTDAPKTAAQDVKWSQGRTYAEMKAAYYDYPEAKFASYQRVLCNKCHAKD